jgi:hypothetical protein
MRGLKDDEIWGDDPVHPLPEVYGRIADGVIKMTSFLVNKLAARNDEFKRRRADSMDTEELELRRNRQDHVDSSSSRGGSRDRGWGDYRPPRGHYGNRGRITRGTAALSITRNARPGLVCFAEDQQNARPLMYIVFI